jgi:hypothetical protein
MRGKGKRFMIGLFGFMISLGVCLTIAGVIALIQKQPFHVHSPLFLGALVTLAVFGPMLPVILARYRQAESRRMEAEQFRRA